MKLQAFLVFGLTVVLPAAAADAWATGVLKKVQVTDGSQVDLFFDGRVTARQVKTEFIGDIVQLSISDTSVYPAKISSVSGSELTKVFAYQYAPKLVRCRLTVRGKAESYRDRLQLKPSGKVLSIRLGQAGSADRISYAAASAARAAAPAPNDGSDLEEKALLQKVLQGTAQKAGAGERVAGEAQQLTGRQGSGDRPLAGGKPLPSPFHALGMLGVVLAIFGALAMLAKKLRSGPGQGRSLSRHKGFSRFLGKFGELGAKKRMIEMVASHYLGPKKSIAVVRVSGRLLVLGITNESINLITQLSGEGDAQLEELAIELGEGQLQPESQLQPKPGSGSQSQSGVGATAAGPAAFADLLGTESAKPSAGAATGGAAQASSVASVRAQIRSRMEGMKPL